MFRRFRNAIRRMFDRLLSKVARLDEIKTQCNILRAKYRLLSRLHNGQVSGALLFEIRLAHDQVANEFNRTRYLWMPRIPYSSEWP